ncbi:conserved hypothetical protein [Burkholderia cepacia]
MTSEIGTVALGEGSARPGPGWAESASEPVIASPSVEPLALYLSGPRGVFRARGTPGLARRADAISRCG